VPISKECPVLSPLLAKTFGALIALELCCSLNRLDDLK